VSPSAGVLLRAKPGDRIEQGAPLLDLLADEAARIPDGLAALDGAIEIGDEPPAVRPLVHERIKP
jgi:thymidine phosphorylase